MRKIDNFWKNFFSPCLQLNITEEDIIHTIILTLYLLHNSRSTPSFTSSLQTSALGAERSPLLLFSTDKYKKVMYWKLTLLFHIFRFNFPFL